LARHEGLRRYPYIDTVGKLSIGYGRNLDDTGITTDEAEYLLSGDIDRAIRGLVGHFPNWFPALDPVRQAVLINMAFNLGVVGVSGFHDTLAAVAAGRYGAAADAMLASRWAGQVGQRAVELAAQMKTGAYQV
jgi:lysozyme